MHTEVYDCFLSYCATDVEAARVIYSRLLRGGFSVWWDKIYLEAGMRWHDEIEHHCAASRIVLPLLTPEWKQSEWTRYETYGAEYVIPLLLRGDWDSVSTPPLAIVQGEAIQIGDWDATPWKNLFERLRLLLARPREGRTTRKILLRHRPASEIFVGRDKDLVGIHEKLFLTRRTALTHGSVIALPALGGVGKTSLARHYAEKFWRAYHEMFWVDARVGYAAEFSRIYDFLHPGEETSTPLETRALRFLREISQHDTISRLLILDNAEDEESVLPWVPQSGDCHVLITSRYTAWSPAIATHPVRILEPEHAVEFLLKRSGREGTSSEAGAALKVAQKLQFLPLALEVAAAYVQEQSGLCFADYLRLYKENEQYFLNRTSPGLTRYPDSVYLTWRATREKLSEGAKAMLRLQSFFAPTPLAIQMYIEGAQELAIHSGAPQSVPSEFEIRDWKSELIRYSMALQEPRDCISVHALVQAVEQHTLRDTGRYAEADDVARRVLISYGGKPSWEPESRQKWDILLPHAEVLVELEKTEQKDDRQELLWRIGEAHRARGSYRAGAAVYAECLQIREHVLGLEHPDTLNSINNLATLLERVGDYDAAEPLFRRALEARERVLGLDHPSTLGSINNLGLVLYGKGDYDDAEPLFRRAIEANERVLGPEHPTTLTCLNNLALVLYRKGNYTAAEPLYRRALEARERVLGPDHPDTLYLVDNLAGLLCSKGDYDDAELLCRRALEARERVLGLDHPVTLQSIHNLGLLLNEKGDYDAAEPLCRRALEAREHLFGPENISTILSIHNLAGLFYNKGDYDAAEPLYRRAVETASQVLGTNHPYTRTFIKDLESCRQAIVRSRPFDQSQPSK